MKKLVILIVIYFVSFQISSQNLEELSKLDTIYIPFKEKKGNKKTIFPKGQNNYNDRIYYIKLKDNTKEEFNLVLVNNKVIFGNLSSNLILKKSEIDKLLIINFKELQNLQKCELDDFFLSRKIFYIIDYSEGENCNVSLYQVLPYRICETIDD